MRIVVGDDDVLIWNVAGDSWAFNIFQVRFAFQLADIPGNPFRQVDCALFRLTCGADADVYGVFARLSADGGKANL